MFLAAALLNVQLRLQPDEANAVLDILDKRAADWERLFTSEGYIRLKKREESMKRSLGDFRAFVDSDELLARRCLQRRTPKLRQELSRGGKVASWISPTAA